MVLCRLLLPILLLPILLLPSVASAFWTEQGPEGGSVQFLTTAASNPSVVIGAVSPSPNAFPHTVRKSVDGGRTWFDITPPVAIDKITSLAIDPRRATTLYVATRSQGLWLSRDGGQTWTHRSDRNNLTGLSVDPQTQGLLYAYELFSGHHSDSVVLSSTDGGVRWSSDRTPQPPESEGSLIGDLQLHPTTPGVVFLATSYGVYRSRQGLTGWQRVSEFPAYSLRFDPTSARRLDAGSLGQVWRSTDGGDHWQLRGDLGVDAAILSLRGDPTHLEVMLAGTMESGLWRSGDDGVTWSLLPILEPNIIQSMTVTRSEVLASVASRGVFRSDDGGVEWQDSSRGLGRVTIVSAAVDPFSPQHLIVAIAYGLEESHDGGRTWSHLRTDVYPPDQRGALLLNRVLFDPHHQGTIYAGLTFAAVIQSTDGGQTWQVRNEGWQDPAYAQDLAISPHLPGALFGAGRGGVFRSLDGAASWELQGQGVPAGSVARRVVADPLQPSRLLAAIYSESSPFGTKPYRSLDGGESWHLVDVGICPDDDIRDLVFDPQDSDRMYAVATGGLYRSDDGGDHWDEMQIRFVGAAPETFSSLAIDPQRSEVLYLGTSAGLYRSLNGGQRWHALGPDARPIGPLEVVTAQDGETRTLFAATDAGLLSRPSLTCGDGGAVCLGGTGDGRFLVEVGWRDFAAVTGRARPVTATGDSSLLYFFQPDNWEMLVKVIDGCDFNGHHWVFAASATNLAYQIRVTDLDTSEVRLYDNGLGMQAPALTDTAAFPCSFFD